MITRPARQADTRRGIARPSIYVHVVLYVAAPTGSTQTGGGGGGGGLATRASAAASTSVARRGVDRPTAELIGEGRAAAAAARLGPAGLALHWTERDGLGRRGRENRLAPVRGRAADVPCRRRCKVVDVEFRHVTRKHTSLTDAPVASTKCRGICKDRTIMLR